MLDKLNRLVSADGFDQAYQLSNAWARLMGRLIYRRRFEAFGERTTLRRPAQILGAPFIGLGNDVRIEPGAILYAVRQYAGAACQGTIHIGSGTYMNRNCNISAAAPIFIGRRVTIATNVFICNYDHDYELIDVPINDQPLRVHGEISIGDGSWLGANACVLGGVKVGRHSVIGANSVVTTNIPDLCIAVGTPARVVRQYDIENRQWRRINL